MWRRTFPEVRAELEIEEKIPHVGDVKCWNPAGFPQVAREGSPSGDLGARARHTPGHYGPSP